MIDLKRRARLAVVIPLLLAGTRLTSASPALLVDADTGVVLHQEEATAPWYPASLSKLVTAYVALKAIKDGKISADQPLLVTPRAAKMSPSKMGFRPGTIVTLDNALKMLMVKSANDMAVTIAEGVGGSVEGFAEQMNAATQSLGMRESHWVNPNGLPDPQQVSSARDMALVARALINEFPEHRGLFGIGSLRLGNQIINNHNGLLGRYPGVDGMKTGFTCSAGFNLVASATRGGRHLIGVVLGSSTVRNRNQRVAELLDRGFAGTETGTDQINALPTTQTDPPDRHAETCLASSRAAANEEAAEITASHGTQAPATAAGFAGLAQGATAAAQPSPADPELALGGPADLGPPVPVYIGPAPGWTGPLPEGGRTSSDLATAYAAPAAHGAAAAAATALAGRGRARVKSLRSGRPVRQAAVKSAGAAKGKGKAPAKKTDR